MDESEYEWDLEPAGYFSCAACGERLDTGAQIRAHRCDPDGSRLRTIADFEAIAINQWIVQVRANGKWFTAYHGTPPSGTPAKLYGSKLEALQAAIDEARRDAA